MQIFKNNYSLNDVLSKKYFDQLPLNIDSK